MVYTAQKMKVSIKNFFLKYNQIRILLRKSLMIYFLTRAPTRTFDCDKSEFCDFFSNRFIKRFTQVMKNFLTNFMYFYVCISLPWRTKPVLYYQNLHLLALKSWSRNTSQKLKVFSWISSKTSSINTSAIGNCKLLW